MFRRKRGREAMSYDVKFVAKLEGIDKYVSVIGCDANITWNAKELIKQSSGWEIENEMNDVIDEIMIREICFYTGFFTTINKVELT